MSALVIYHGNCYDGFTSAFIAHENLKDPILWPGKYGESPPLEECKEREVYVLDFSYPRDQMYEIAEACTKLVVLDHHKTAREALDGLTAVLRAEVMDDVLIEFDMERSGAGMTWDYFHRDWDDREPRPWWVNRIEDRDLWRFKYGESTKNVHAFFASRRMNLAEWRRATSSTLEEAETAGSGSRDYIDVYLDKAVVECRVVDWGGNPSRRAVVLNIPYQNANEAADLMLAEYPKADFSCGYFQRADGRWQYSLRSRDGFDVSEIAKVYGGGGHAQAAGFDTESLIL